MEINNDVFEVEKSEDGISFYTIGKVKGAGNSQQTMEYLFIDEAAIVNSRGGVVYYRLKQIDFDGEFEVFDIVALNFGVVNRAQLFVYPNPARTYLSVYSTEIFDDKFSYNVSNFYGVTVLDGFSEWSQPLSVVGLKSGVYRLLINGVMSTKIVVE